jgi:putative transposase
VSDPLHAQPALARPEVRTRLAAPLVRSIFEQPDADSAWAQHARVVEQLTGRFDAAADLLAESADEILAFTAFPKAHWRQLRSNNPLSERLNKEIRRRTDAVGIFPNRAAVIRLVGAVLAEQHDEWQVARRYMSADSLATARTPTPEPADEQEDQPALPDAA